MNVQTGIDIIEVDRIQKAIEGQGEKFLNYVFTKQEIEYCDKTNKMKYQHYAARFAAKEAIIKATHGQFDFKEIEITKADSGKPIPKIINKENIIIDLSLSYDQDYAIAFCTVKNSQN